MSRLGDILKSNLCGLSLFLRKVICVVWPLACPLDGQLPPSFLLVCWLFWLSGTSAYFKRCCDGRRPNPSTIDVILVVGSPSKIQMCVRNMLQSFWEFISSEAGFYEFERVFITWNVLIRMYADCTCRHMNSGPSRFWWRGRHATAKNGGAVHVLDLKK